MTRTDELTTGRIVLPAGPLSWEPLAPARHQRWAWFVAPVVVLVLAVVAASLVTVPYYSLSPGVARPVGDLIAVPDDQRHPPKGDVLLTTVSLRQVTLLEALQGWLDPDVDVYEQEAIFGPISRDEYREQNVQLMDDSKQVAAVVALRRLGYPVPESGDGAIVNDVAAGSPAAGLIDPGDTVVTAGGRTVSLREDLVDAVRAKRPGESIRLEIDAGSTAPRRQVDIRLGRLVTTKTTAECVPVPAEVPTADGDACLGVNLLTRSQSFDFPFDVTVESGRIGGPSAGLAFTLGVLDVLRPGELTGGRKVAVTGTIDVAGTVGEVGGVNQKTAAAIAQGAEVFIVPRGEYADAKKRAGSALEVVAVTTLEEALTALGRIGGDVTALGPPPTPR